MICPTCQHKTNKLSGYYDPELKKIVEKCDNCKPKKENIGFSVIGQKTGGNW